MTATAHQTHEKALGAPAKTTPQPGPLPQFTKDGVSAPEVASELARLLIPKHPEMPAEFQARLDLAQVFLDSGLTPKGLDTVPRIFLALQLGAELGLAPFYAIQNCAVVNGRAGLMFAAKLAVARSTGLLEEYREEVTDTVARVWVKRRGREGFWSEFTMAEAETAGLTKPRGNATSLYKLYPKRMLRARAGSWGIDREFGDALAGILSGEELSDMDDASTTAPAATKELGRPAWRMTMTEVAHLKTVVGALKIPARVKDAIVAECVGGREVERIDGIPQFTEPEYRHIASRLKEWRPEAAPKAATSRTTPDEAKAQTTSSGGGAALTQDEIDEMNAESAAMNDADGHAAEASEDAEK